MSIDEKIKKIYNRISDDESRRIYADRLLYNMTGDPQYMKNIIFTKDKFRDLRDWLIFNKDKERILFGAGEWSGGIVYGFRKYYDTELTCYADNNIAGQKRYGMGVISFETLCSEHRDACILITSLFHEEDIYKQLIGAGFMKENIARIPSIVNYYLDRQYFDLPFISYDEDEIFVDDGACDGATARQFANVCSGNYKYIYSFEPNVLMEPLLSESFRNLKGEYILKGTWDKATTLTFMEGGQGSHIVEGATVEKSGADSVEVCSIDEALGGQAVTFIKMDVEGSEERTIAGAEQTIRKYKPRMAISLYHKKEDPWEIPSLLLDYNPEYHFSLRHYFFDDRETVLYAF